MLRQIPGGVTAPRGYRASGVRCGLKSSGNLDLALVVPMRRHRWRGLTTNQVQAAPVLLSREVPGAAQP